MVIINAVKIEAITRLGTYGAFEKFSNGLNIIKANNSSGKSTLIQCILYSLGLEELLGGRNEKAMQSVLKDSIEFENQSIPVIESNIFCEISNGIDTVTIKRAVVSPNKSNKLITIYDGSFLLSNDNKESYNTRQMYVHDAGSAKDVEFGFHMFLEGFLNWNIPNVHFVDDTERKLYLQTIFASFIIEQKKGWSNFLATIPYYGIKSVESRVIEYLLDFDSYSLENKKIKLKQQLKDLDTKWFLTWENFKNILNRASLSSNSIQDVPHAISGKSAIYIYYATPDENIEYNTYIHNLTQEYNSIKDIEIIRNNENSSVKQAQLKELNEKLERYIFTSDKLNSEIFNERKKLESLYKQLVQIENDLSKNESISKITRLGGVTLLEISKGNCPTCHQQIADSLLPQDIGETPMLIDDNIAYLKAQRGMVKAFINSNKDYLLDIEDKNTKYQYQIGLLRNEIKSIKKDLVADDRMPSVSQIESRLELRKKIEFFNNLKLEIETIQDKLISLSADWVKLNGDLKELPKNSFSAKDEEKLSFLTSEVKRMLSRFNYTSKPISDVNISRDKFIPTINSYNIAFDSSASDLIRSIWSYTCALFKTSDKFGGNHPRLLIFDEPGQHSMSDSDLQLFFKELAGYECQTLVAASFNNDENIFKNTTIGFQYNLIRFEGKLIKKNNGDHKSEVA